MKIVTDNRKAHFDYVLSDRFEAGMELWGSEVKSLRAGQVNLKDSYVAFIGDQAYLQNAHISPYRASSYNNHEPERNRRLLLNRAEIDKIQRAVEEKGFTCVPTKIYFKDGWAKVEIALAKGKTKGDKRQSIKARDTDREMAKAMKRR